MILVSEETHREDAYTAQRLAVQWVAWVERVLARHTRWTKWGWENARARTCQKDDWDVRWGRLVLLLSTASQGWKWCWSYVKLQVKSTCHSFALAPDVRGIMVSCTSRSEMSSCKSRLFDQESKFAFTVTAKKESGRREGQVMKEKEKGENMQEWGRARETLLVNKTWDLSLATVISFLALDSILFW